MDEDEFRDEQKVEMTHNRKQNSVGPTLTVPATFLSTCRPSSEGCLPLADNKGLNTRYAPIRSHTAQHKHPPLENCRGSN